MKRQNVRTLSLVVCTFTYLLIGAAVFDAMESETERKQWDILSDMKRLMMQKYKISAEDYKMLEIVVTENRPNKSGPQWKFAGSFYFATVVLATIAFCMAYAMVGIPLGLVMFQSIGYGHSTPVTVGGKAFCMAYAMVGIPLGLVMFQSIGERLNKFAFIVIHKMKSFLGCKKNEVTQMNLMFATGLLSSIIITSGAALFSTYEGWTYFDSFYYCFVTLTTIGFGDYVALQNDQALTKKPGYVALSLVFVLFGLAVVAASINLLVLRFMMMQAEENRRDELEEELQKRILIDENASTSLKGKLLTGRLLPNRYDDTDQVSVCSCSCLDLRGRYSNHETLLPSNIMQQTSPYTDSYAIDFKAL